MVKATHPLNGPHTAGIFADLTIDGPIIGTLVVIVDRAKNLPNRKTIGKQDPYCAARLGKEAKKTTTDIRGGQTPKWDQELRFTVHDSPDYYQLKVSVFNDDKKTDLIGETWIDLRDIVVPGGGQNDLWQNLTCKGKYAGGIRIEITYYDSRPKPEKPAAKPKPVTSESDSLTGSQRAAVKRRPLPSDPFTGQNPAQPPQPASNNVPTPPRQQPIPPRDYINNESVPDHAQAPPRVSQSTSPVPYPMNHAPGQAGQYGTPPSLRHRQPEHYSSGPNSAYHTLSQSLDGTQGSPDRYAVYPEDTGYTPDHHGHTPDKRYTPSAPYGASPSDPSLGADFQDERPPPPPVHRTTPSNGTPEARYSPSRELALQGQTPPIMRKEVLRSEAHRQSVPSNEYPGRPVYRAYDSAPGSSPPSNDPYAAVSLHEPPPPRHNSYDTSYDSHHRAMQATVEDVPESPGQGLDDFRRNGTRAPQYIEPDYRKNPSPAPLNLSGRGSASVDQYRGSSASTAHRQTPSLDYGWSDPSLSSGDYPGSNSSAPPQHGYKSWRTGSDQELEDTQVRAPDGSLRYALPPVPTALIPGVDPGLSVEISQRINEDRRHERRHTQPPPQSQPPASLRGRRMIEPPPSYCAPPPDRPLPYTTPQHSHDSYDPYDCSPVLYSGGSSSRQIARREDISPSLSPSGQHTIQRKSISPAPPPDGRRLSGIPFGPDSYDALNPSLAPKEPVRSEYDENNGKIITHDGKEIDPSDHLPMDTWAPEPEPRVKKQAPATDNRPHLSGPQPIPPSGRRPLRIREARPSSVAALPPATFISPESNNQPLPPPTTGRNRLQKKANRSSAMPVMMSGANGPGPGPLAPLPQPQDNFTPRPLGRASTFDYENHAPPPTYKTSSGSHSRDHSASAPPIPAKVPLNTGSSMAMVPMNRGGYGAAGNDFALMEEMSRIDIGTGRARRHGQRVGY